MPILDATPAARAWVDACTHAWPAKDPEPVASLYAEDAVFYWASEPGRREPPAWASE